MVEFCFWHFTNAFMLFCHDFGNVVNDAISVQFFEPKMMLFATMIGVGATHSHYAQP